MENDEVIPNKQYNNDRESQDITLKEGVDSIDCDAEEKKKMKEGEYPIWHCNRQVLTVFYTFNILELYI